MPYIKQEDRGRLRFQNNPKTEGELNYLLTLEYLRLIQEMGESYTNYGKIRQAIDFLVFDLHLLRTTNKSAKLLVDYNFIETRLRVLCRNYYKVNQGTKTDQDILADTIGALINSSSELYRRKIGPYEDKAIERNGDVY